MNVVEKTGTNLRPNAVDFDRFRLRRYVESLAALGSRFAIHGAGFSLVVERPGAYRTRAVVASATGYSSGQGVSR